MENKRRHKRIQLNCMLDVFDVKSKKILGQVLDLTIEGFQMMRKQPIAQDSEFTVKIQLPEIISGHTSLELSIKKVWEMEEMNIYYSGFRIEKTSINQTEVLRAIINKYGND